MQVLCLNREAVIIKRLICILTVVALCVTGCSFTAGALTLRELPAVSAECAVVVEIKTGKIIAGKNEHKRASMASTTKIMTALLLCEMCDLESTAVVTKEMVTVEGSSMGLLAGDTVHYRDLLYGMMLASGNDAATSTAYLIAGSLDKFAELMNKRAAKIGMTNTHFVTPSGLDADDHYSTAYDMALLATEAMKNEDFAQAVGSKSATLEYGNPPYRRTLTNHNKLLSYYKYCTGVKTGFTKKSGRCLVSSAEHDGKGVVAVTLNAPNDWRDHEAMLSFGLEQLVKSELEVPQLPKISVINGSISAVTLRSEALSVALLPEDIDRVTAKTMLQPVAFANIESGETVGEVRYYLDDKLVAASSVYTTESSLSNELSYDKNLLYWFKLLIKTM